MAVLIECDDGVIADVLEAQKRQIADRDAAIEHLRGRNDFLESAMQRNMFLARENRRLTARVNKLTAVKQKRSYETRGNMSRGQMRRWARIRAERAPRILADTAPAE